MHVEVSKIKEKGAVVKKQNNLIRSPIFKKVSQSGVEVETFEAFSEKEHDLINAFLLIIQTYFKGEGREKSLMDYLPSEKDGMVLRIALPELQKLAKIKNRSIARMNELLESITGKKIKLKGRIFWLNGAEKKEISVRENTTLIERTSIITVAGGRGRGNQNIIEIQPSRLFIALSLEEVYLPSGFTNIDHAYITSLRGAVPKALYQTIHSWGQNLKPGESSQLVLKTNDLQVICGVQPHMSHYRKILRKASEKIDHYKIEIAEETTESITLSFQKCQFIIL